MNTYSNHRVYIFGTWIRDGHNDIAPFTGSWAELLKSDGFPEFRKKHEITDSQLAIIKRGFHGWPIDPPVVAEVPEVVEEDEQLFPFGTHKGKPMSSVPDDYYLFLLKQPWLVKWPTVSMYARTIKNKVNKDAASPEEIKNILHKIN